MHTTVINHHLQDSCQEIVIWLALFFKRSIIHWNDIKWRQRSGFCNVRTFINCKIFPFGCYSNRFWRHTGKCLIALCLKCGPQGNLSFKGNLALTLHPIPLFLQESGHPTPLRECAERTADEMGLSLWVILLFRDCSFLKVHSHRHWQTNFWAWVTILRTKAERAGCHKLLV